jgi:hypothetical protein
MSASRTTTAAAGQPLSASRFRSAGRRRWRDLKLVVLVALTGLFIALYLAEALELAAQQGSGWRTLDLQSLQRRIESGELTDRKADLYRPHDLAG